MSDKLKYMKGEEFLRWLLSGERDFSGIELEEGFDLCQIRVVEHALIVPHELSPAHRGRHHDTHDTERCGERR
jgi:hypothetical protein